MKRAIYLGLISALSLCDGAALAEPAFMIMTFNQANRSPSGGGLVVREYASMDSCEAVAKHIHSLRGIEYDESNWDIKGVWRSNRGSEIKQEPFVATLCVPHPSEIDTYKESIEKIERYKLLD